MKLSGELEYRIRYDVEHDLFHAQNVFNDEYIKPTFIEYVQKLEKENAELKNRDCWKSCEYANPKAELIGQHIKDVQNLTKAKDLLKRWLKHYNTNTTKGIITDTEQFLKEE